MQKNILIVEDDHSVAEGLEDILSGCGYQAFTAANSAKALEKLRENRIHLIILDIHLGADDGYTLCRKIRENADTPILFLTACSSELELIRGFQAGGDDYMTKPFRIQELLVRISALLRRAARQEGDLKKSGDILCSFGLRQIQAGGQLLDLTATEWKLAYALLSHYPQTLTREALLSFVWDKDANFVEANTLNVNISRLRDKLGTFLGKPYIETVRGVGYRWAVPVTG